MVHRGSQSAGLSKFDRLDGASQTFCQGLAFFQGKSPQNVIHDAPLGGTDADAQPGKLQGA